MKKFSATNFAEMERSVSGEETPFLEVDFRRTTQAVL